MTSRQDKQGRSGPGRGVLARLVRFAIQAFFFLWAPAAFISAFSGCKYVLARMGMGERIELNSLLLVFLAVSLLTILFGRFFCGFICSFGSLGDWIFGLRGGIEHLLRRRGFRFPVIPERVGVFLAHIKYEILALVCIFSFLGYSEKMKSVSPWTSFARMRAADLRLGIETGGWILLGLIFLGCFLQERFFCRFLCPLGAIFSILPNLPFFSIYHYGEKEDKECPLDLEIPDRESGEDAGVMECIQCQRCQNCRRAGAGGDNRTYFRKLKGNELWWTLVRALVFGVVFWLLHI